MGESWLLIGGWSPNLMLDSFMRLISTNGLLVLLNLGNRAESFIKKKNSGFKKNPKNTTQGARKRSDKNTKCVL